MAGVAAKRAQSAAQFKVQLLNGSYSALRGEGGQLAWLAGNLSDGSR